MYTWVYMKKILLIDDDQFIRDVVGAKLSESYILSIAATGEEGYTLINESTPDLVLLDLDLPDMAGMTILADLKKRKQQKRFLSLFFQIMIVLRYKLKQKRQVLMIFL